MINPVIAKSFIDNIQAKFGYVWDLDCLREVYNLSLIDEEEYDYIAGNKSATFDDIKKHIVSLIDSEIDYYHEIEDKEEVVAVRQLRVKFVEMEEVVFLQFLTSVKGYNRHLSSIFKNKKTNYLIFSFFLKKEDAEKITEKSCLINTEQGSLFYLYKCVLDKYRYATLPDISLIEKEHREVLLERAKSFADEMIEEMEKKFNLEQITKISDMFSEYTLEKKKEVESYDEFDI